MTAPRLRIFAILLPALLALSVVGNALQLLRTRSMPPESAGGWPESRTASSGMVGEAAPANPEGKRWGVRISIRSIASAVPIQVAMGVPIKNTAGDFLDAVQPANDEELTVEFTSAAVDLDGLDEAMGDGGQGAVNADGLMFTIHGQDRYLAPGTLLFAGYSIAWQPDPLTGKLSPHSTYRLRWRRGGWALHLPNVGYAHMEGGKKIANADQSRPMPLAADGTLDTSGGAALTVVYAVHPAADFAVILWGLDTD